MLSDCELRICSKSLHSNRLRGWGSILYSQFKTPHLQLPIYRVRALTNQLSLLSILHNTWWSASMFPIIFQSLCAHKISFVQHFTRTHLYLEWRIWNMGKTHFWKEHLCALQVFLSALTSQPLCARTRAQLRENIGLHQCSWEIPHTESLALYV